MRERWDAGDIGCARLLVELRARVSALGAGEEIEVVARSPGAPEDVPAWCRMTGHVLVSAEHPVYVVRRRVD